ncbi:unnamed protein product [Spodoptera exigua]|nr:unnamed protein product [Spodoptera exigua]
MVFQSEVLIVVEINDLTLDVVKTATTNGRQTTREHRIRQMWTRHRTKLTEQRACVNTKKRKMLNQRLEVWNRDDHREKQPSACVGTAFSTLLKSAGVVIDIGAGGRFQCADRAAQSQYLHTNAFQTGNMVKRSKNKKSKVVEKAEMQYDPVSSSQAQGQPPLTNLPITHFVGGPAPLNSELLNSKPSILQLENLGLNLLNLGTSLPNLGAPLPSYHESPLYDGLTEAGVT